MYARLQPGGGNREATAPPYCEFCCCHVTGSWAEHTRGPQHVAASSTPARRTDNDYVFCQVCRGYVHPDAWTRHTTSRVHKQHVRHGILEGNMEESARERHGIDVSHSAGLDYGILNMRRAREGVIETLVVKCLIPQANIRLLSAGMASVAAGRNSAYVH